MGERRRLVLGILFATFFHICYGCQMEGVTNWAIPQPVTIFDYFNGTVVNRNTANIEGIISVTYGESTLRGPYFDITLEDSQFVITTNAAYEDYEEYEVSTLVSITVDFRCSGVTPSNSLIFLITITDTNNNRPIFIPSNSLEFVVTPPLPPGYIITGCFDYITVRDIDLTTQRIDFTIDDNPYFEIEYDAAASTEPKEFKAVVRTKTFIRSLSEPVTYTITATDVDETEGPPLSATASLRIVADSEFQFPEEPIFGQAFYLANYTETHQFNLFETISLQQGFDEYVDFTLDGEYRDYFHLIPNGNELTLDVVTPLPIAVWSQRQTYLIVRAVREFTSGDTTTVVVQFPEEEPLQFESAIYEGAIINNALQLSQLVLTQGYVSDTISADIEGEYSSYFTASVQGNLIILSMLPLTDQIIENNSFISIQVIASGERSEATTVVNLEVIKDDNVTPVFDKAIYYATYDPSTGLNAEQITFVQGFDDTVDVTLYGEYSSLFNTSQDGLIITLTSSTIPPELYSLQNILISIEASKPRTVGANAVISIALPAAREIEFEESIYRGIIENNEIRLDTIQLRTYATGVTFQLSGEYSTYFTAADAQQGQVVISLSSALPETIVTQNNVILLTLTADGTNVVPTTTNILLDIIKEDSTTPIFTQNIYYGTYDTTLQIENINLAQGFEGATFRLDGAHAQYFSISNTNGNNAVITLQSPIPEEVIFNEKVLLFNVLADKALTVGANAAVLITFPTELTDAAVMRFSQNAYFGQLDENDLILENIVLDTGYATGTEFLLTGDYSEHFNVSTTSNVVQISSLGTLPDEVLENNEFLILEIEARRPRAVSAWTSVIVDIVKDIVTPIFNQAYYSGAYTEEIGLMFEETINLEEGYDETVTFALVGEWSTLFRLEQEYNIAYLTLAGPMPSEIIENNNQLLLTVVAENSFNLTGRAVISIDLPKDFLNSTFRFSQNNYKGYIEDNNLTIAEIVLQDYTNGVTYSLDGEYSDYFQLTSQLDGTFTLRIQNPLPEDVIEQTNVLILTLNAQNSNIRTHTAIVIEIMKIIEDIIEFEQPYYIGSYSETTQLEFNSEIRVTDTGSVIYQLEGDDAQWFGLQENEDSVTVVLTSPIPAGVISNNQQLVFVVTAQRPGSATARATVVIEFTDELTILGFERVAYVGSIENGQSSIPVITLSEGYVQGVQFALLGDLSDYFSVTPQGAMVTVALQNAIPDQLIPANRIIVLELQATAPGAIPAVATIVVEYVVDEDVSTIVELVFAQTFYSGSYSVATGLSFPTPLSLSDGYDSTVVFALEGENAQWFGLQRLENSVTVVLTSHIPAGVISNNQQLVFVVTAQRPGSATARATVVIELTDELTENSAILGFERVTYVGSIENGQSSIPVITLSEGYVQGVQFALLGELSDYFSVTPQGAMVTVALQNAIPDQLIPANRIIVLELQATAPGAIPAVATIVVEYVVDEDVSTIVELVFAQTFYSGSYSVATGLSFPTPLSLSDGYDSTVVFALEGKNAQWFGLQRLENSVTVVLTSPIPAGVISNNQQLVFVVTAQRPGSATARATVVIELTDELTENSAILGFERVTYVGSIENGQSSIPMITLSEGYVQGVQFSLLGELSDYFSVTPQGAVVTVALQNAIPDQLIPANRIIVLELQATAPGAIPAVATIVVEYVVDEDVSTIVELVFAQTFYSGSYSVATGLSFPTPLSLSDGYDSTVVFALEGENAQWFGLQRIENSVTVVLTSPIPAGVISNNQQLVFVVTAQRPGSATARSTVVIELSDELTENSAILGFERVTYVGSIENGQSSIPVITLSEGYVQGVQFSLLGELSDYFSVTPQGAVVTVALQNAIPDQLIPANRIIVLELQATAPGAIPAVATIVVEYVVDEDVSTIVELVFAQTFYSGSYSVATGLSFPTPLSLSDGYDSTVVFALEGENAQWFGLQRLENSVTVVLTSPIPAGVISNNQQLVFVVTAQRPGSATARATVVIELTDELTENSAILGFERVTYVGSIENGQSSIPVITLSEGYVQGVQFSLLGELSDYFSVTPQGAVVTVALQNAIPDQLIPANRIIVLELQATAPGAIPAVATIVVEYVVDEDVSTIVELVFAQTFYSGSYSVATGLSFPTPLSLSDGYDSTVVFALEGENAQWFGLQRLENSVTVVLTSPIPAGVISNNQQLVFVVTAQRPGSATARATVVIELTDELTENSAILGFERVTYVGSIENGQSSIPVITLSEGYVQGVQFSLLGELSDYFSVTPQGAVVTVALQNAIPDQLIPANRIIVLELQATAPGAIPAVATIVVEYVVDEDVSTIVELVFAQTFYSGSYSVATGLSFPTPLSLSDGYDSTVVFALEGENAQWFGLQRLENSVTVVLTSPIPAGVISNNQQLVFVVTAQRPGSATARATVVIELTDELTENSAILGFERVTYVGSIENGQSSIPVITLSEGYVQGVQFSLLGELSDYFSVTPQGTVVTVALQNAIPDQLIPANRIIVLELQATAPGAIPAVATIVVEYVVDEDVSTIVELVFAQTFYSGSYSVATGLSFPTPLSLSDGYDSTVVFALEGENAQWFGLQRIENSVTVVLTSPIPAGVISNNQQLVFVVTAQRPGSATARSTVVIELTDELTENSAILGFERVTYVGSIENGQSSIPVITLSEGYVQGVQFSLLGELSDYFSVTPQGAVVTVALQNAIPDQLIPANRIIVLELQATAPGAIPAVATIVVEYVVDEDVSTIVELVFAQTFYSGSYSVATGLSFPTPLSLSDGYDSTVVFALEGENAQWFGLQRLENSVTVVLTSPIPAGVISNNQQLVFVVTAQRPGSATARATVVIELTDELTENSAILGFERVTYVGSIENGQSSIPVITLSEGYVQGVQFALLGELSDYFSLTPQGAVVTVVLQNAIPDQLIPANRIIVLELQATAPGAIPAVATIVVEYVVDEDVSTIVELVFAQTFYSGSYSVATGLSFPTPLSLSDGYDSTVVFALEGENAQWFGLQRLENSVTVVLTSPIPAGVISNNQQLVFVVTAQRPGSATARATVVIELTDELTENSAILGFERVTYVGSIENGQSSIPVITLSEGYVQGVQFSLLGELSDYFSVTPQGAVVMVALQNAIPDQLIPANRIIVLELQATAPGAIPAVATIVVEYVVDEDVSTIVELVFAQTFYSGSYSVATGLSFPTPLSLSDGYDSTVVFALEGENAQWFGLQRIENSVTVVLTSPIPAGVISNNQQLVFVVTAQRPGSATARSTVVIELTDELMENSAILGFERVTYVGSIENGQSSIPVITLSEGYVQGVQFALLGELSDYFSLTPQGAVVTVVLQNAIPDQLIPANRIIVLELQATAPGAIPAAATIVVEYVVDEDVSTIVELVFAQTFYSGSYSVATGLSFPTPLSLSDGYDSTVVFALEGENAQWFGLQRLENSVTVVLTSPIPAGVISNNQQLVFVVTAQRPSSATARATVVIELTDESQAGSDIAFEKALYEGIVQNGVVSHETIIVTGFSGSNVELHGEYSTLFETELSNNEVRVQTSSSLTLPVDVAHIALELRAGTAATVLLLNVIQTDGPSLPTVTFNSPSYAIGVDITQTGLVGQVQATSDNGENVLYSLMLNNAHLEERLSVNSEGELNLWAPVNNGVYTFQVIATTVFTQTSGSATVHLTVDAVTICGGDNVIAPLIIIDVDEEEPHHNLIDAAPENCHYTLTNRWPLDQSWLYIDDGGLHTTAIDREDESIAFMAVSQVQVEVVLHCEGDATRSKRSVNSDALGPYDYGNNRWILTDTISHNSRRSLVNVIVNDINDNAPIFVGKESEPIAVGYVIPELAERVLPRSLAELQATDADIGENAALLYWSSAPELAVAPSTGFVHVSDGSTLTHGSTYTVHATDRNGQGLTGSIDILVRLLDESNIAVVTVRDAFLDDEQTVLSHLSEGVGYEVKMLRSVVISDSETSEENSRKRRDVSNEAGASLQLYVYGLIQREPVAVDRLTTDISNIALTAVIVASTVSLEDHLEAQEICVIAGRDTGLLVATIVLSVLLFIVLVLIAVWFFLRWRRKKNYDQFSDENSIASRGESVDKFPRPEVFPKPRLNIAELKKSERRLQEMLDAPVEVITEPNSSRNDAILDLSTPELPAPIVIQSIDKLKDPADESSDDEFGEIKSPRRKSVVTFNENVEKIIHLEDNEPEDISTDSDYEIYKL